MKRKSKLPDLIVRTDDGTTVRVPADTNVILSFPVDVDAKGHGGAVRLEGHARIDGRWTGRELVIGRG